MAPKKKKKAESSRPWQEEREARIAVTYEQILQDGRRCFSQSHALAERLVDCVKKQKKWELEEIKMKCEDECCHPYKPGAPETEWYQAQRWEYERPRIFSHDKESWKLHALLEEKKEKERQEKESTSPAEAKKRPRKAPVASEIAAKKEEDAVAKQVEEQVASESSAKQVEEPVASESSAKKEEDAVAKQVEEQVASESSAKQVEEPVASESSATAVEEPVASGGTSCKWRNQSASASERIQPPWERKSVQRTRAPWEPLNRCSDCGLRFKCCMCD